MENKINVAIKFFEEYEHVFTCSEMITRLVMLLDVDNYGLLQTAIRQRLSRCNGKAEIKRFLNSFYQFLYGRKK